MASSRKKHPIYKEVEIIDAGAEGKAVAKVNDLVIFVPYGAPGDIVDIQITKKKRAYVEGRIVHYHKYSTKRTDPFCEHFGLCGGCKWQHLPYKEQLFYKQKQVVDNLTRIGKLDIPKLLPIIASDDSRYYRNKLEFTFSNRKWLIDKPTDGMPPQMNALGFHIPGLFDRIVDIDHCYLQPDPSNDIRLEIRKFALKNDYSFYDVRKWTGLLRNVIIRTTTTGDLMVIVVFHVNDENKINALMDFLAGRFPEITSLIFVVNPKKNDTIFDLEIQLYKGKSYIVEKMPPYRKDEKDLRFKIGPVSFFQTNTLQAIQLYRVALDFADLSGSETVYDLYSGTGTIANYIAGHANKVVGVESITSAIDDARENAIFNNINNTTFFAGDIVKVLSDDFINENGRPDVIITDPPRAGMHPKVVQQICSIAPERIVYISCNPATQARDIAMMTENYLIEKIQPVDMFPHTHHVENVCLLKKR
ncbi:MAG: 23S rRNA (uracil(1939)-C(5))-methyltransferase RlmD [Bacteroidales bacterium]|nr:23S rRNA (uracil(1939)-C(5))-methyltransferase RlmD [Bacteroidales bacterium]